MRAVIALDGSPLHAVAVINLLRLVDHRTSLDRMTVGFYLLLSRGPSVGLEIVRFCDSHLFSFHSLLFLVFIYKHISAILSIYTEINTQSYRLFADFFSFDGSISNLHAFSVLPKPLTVADIQAFLNSPHLCIM